MGKTKKEKKSHSVAYELFGWLVYIAIIVGLTWLIITFVGQRTSVSGHSMETTLQDGDQLIVDKISYRFRDPKRYDIIVFPYQYEENVYYIKRIIGLPGETVQVKDGYVYINGEKLESDIYGKEVMQSAGIAAEPITLGDDEYFVLGDNRNNSVDSRFADVGTVKASYIEGKVWFVLSPSEHRGLVK